MLYEARVEEDQWPSSESPELAGARATRTPAARSSPLPEQAFAAKGFAGASMRGIAAEAGVDAALIHHYFDSKQQLFLATVALPLGLPRNARGGRRGRPERVSASDSSEASSASGTPNFSRPRGGDPHGADRSGPDSIGR